MFRIANSAATCSTSLNTLNVAMQLVVGIRALVVDGWRSEADLLVEVWQVRETVLEPGIMLVFFMQKTR